jgi:uncharacterized protein
MSEDGVPWQRHVNDLLDAGRFDLAVQELLPLADCAEPAALGLLGMLYYLGTGVPHDGNKAARLLAEAAALGYGPAAHNLATLYSGGADGVPPNSRKAAAFYERARQLGCQPAPDGFYRRA